MKYSTDADYQHGNRDRAGILMVNLGTPDSFSTADVRRYLAEFLSDPRVVEVPRLIWKLILHGVILRIRPARSAKAYATVWTEEGSPLLVESKKITTAVAARFADHDISVKLAMRYGSPSIKASLAAMREEGVRRLLVLPMYPQYSCATTASVMDEVFRVLQQQRWIPEIRSINQYCADPGYIEALAASIRQSWDAHGRGQKLIFSYHGVPKAYLLAGDPYHCLCHKTTRLVAQNLGLGADEYLTVFQSRFGRQEWLQPYCDKTLEALPGQGVSDIDICCPAFAADCLETLEEVGEENKEIFLKAGGTRYQFIPCLNDQPEHITALSAILMQHLQGWPEHSPGVDPQRLEEFAVSKREARALLDS